MDIKVWESNMDMQIIETITNLVDVPHQVGRSEDVSDLVDEFKESLKKNLHLLHPFTCGDQTICIPHSLKYIEEMDRSYANATWNCIKRGRIA